MLSTKSANLIIISDLIPTLTDSIITMHNIHIPNFATVNWKSLEGELFLTANSYTDVIARLV